MTAVDVLLQLRYGDFDMNRHLNNVAFAGLAETARLHLARAAIPLGESGGGSGGDVTLESEFGRGWTFFITDLRVEYQRPFPWSIDPIRVRVGVSRIGRSSFDYEYEFFDTAGSVRFAVASSGMILVDAESERPTALNDAQRSLLELIRCAPVAFRRDSARQAVYL